MEIEYTGIYQLNRTNTLERFERKISSTKYCCEALRRGTAENFINLELDFYMGAITIKKDSYDDSYEYKEIFYCPFCGIKIQLNETLKLQEIKEIYNYTIPPQMEERTKTTYIKIE